MMAKKLAHKLAKQLPPTATHGLIIPLAPLVPVEMEVDWNGADGEKWQLPAVAEGVAEKLCI